MIKMRANINVKEFLGDTNKKWNYVVIMIKYSHFFPQSDYPINLINSAINKFLRTRNIENIDEAKNTRDDSSTITVPIPFKDQKSTNSVKEQMQILSANIGVQIKPVFHFQTREIGQILALKSECARKSDIFKIWRQQSKNKFCSYSQVG